MKLILSTLVALAMGAFAAAKIEINVRDLKDGDTFARERTLRVTVNSTHPIRSVEFYVGDSLRDSDTSTPYEFTIDPLNETEGDLTLAFAAYDTEGGSERKSFRVKVDVGTSRGFDALVREGEDALTQQKWDDAIFSARAALKVKPGDNAARILLARGFLGKGVFDKAQQFAQDALEADANNVGARELLAGINLRRAFDTFQQGGDRTQTLRTIAEALKSAADLRRTNLENTFDQAPADDLNRYADLGLRAGRFNAVASRLTPAFNRDPKNAAIGNRLTYALLRQHRLEDALRVLDTMNRENAIDAYGFALKAVAAELAGQPSQADQFLADGQGNDPEEMGVRTAQVFIAMRRANNAALSNLARALATDESQRPETQYYFSVVQHRQANFTDADRAFERAVLAEPAFVDAYIERGNQSLSLLIAGRLTDAEARRAQVEIAKAYYDAALAAKPDSPQALAAIALYTANTGKVADCERFASAAVNAAPTYVAGQFVAAFIYSAIDRELFGRASAIRQQAAGPMNATQRADVERFERQASEFRTRAEAAHRRAIELDRRNLEGRPIPSLAEAFAYFARFGRAPVLTAPR